MPEKTTPITVSCLIAAVLLEEAGGERADHAGGEGADRRAGCRRCRRARRRAGRRGEMASPISDQPLRTRKHERSAAGHRDEHRDDERVPHELELERRGGSVSACQRSSAGLAAPRRARRRRAASIPCFGAKTKAARKISVCRHDDDAAGRAVEEVADVGADEAGHGADRDADARSAAESGRSGGRPWRRASPPWR